jgi:hypothetical protein
LHWASSRKLSNELITLLLEYGASMLKDNKGHTPFDIDLTGLVWRHLLWIMVEDNHIQPFYDHCQDLVSEFLNCFCSISNMGIYTFLLCLLFIVSS